MPTPCRASHSPHCLAWYYNPSPKIYDATSPLSQPLPTVNMCFTVGWELRCGDDGPEKSGS
jgi:hypothetical protein